MNDIAPIQETTVTNILHKFVGLQKDIAEGRRKDFNILDELIDTSIQYYGDYAERRGISTPLIKRAADKFRRLKEGGSEEKKNYCYDMSLHFNNLANMQGEESRIKNEAASTNWQRLGDLYNQTQNIKAPHHTPIRSSETTTVSDVAAAD